MEDLSFSTPRPKLPPIEECLVTPPRWPQRFSEADAWLNQIRPALGVPLLAWIPLGSTAPLEDSRRGVPYAISFEARESPSQFAFDLVLDWFQKTWSVAEKSALDEAGLLPHARTLKLSQSIQSFPEAAPFPVTHFHVFPIAGMLPTAEDSPLPKREQVGILISASKAPLSSELRSRHITFAHSLFEQSRIETLRLKLQARTQFLSIVSHELKTPLTSLYGLLQLSERALSRAGPLSSALSAPAINGEEGTLAPRLQNYVHLALKQAQRLNGLIDDLLDLARIENGRFRIEPYEADFSSLLHEIIEERLFLLAQEASIQLQLDTAPGVKAWIDPARLEELISNLVTHALRRSPEGGIVRIRLSEDADGLRLTVRDQGLPVPSEARERLFKPFEKVPGEVRTNGLGLGLFIAREIARLHRGEVRMIDASPGSGNVLELRLPSLENARSS